MSTTTVAEIQAKLDLDDKKFKSGLTGASSKLKGFSGSLGRGLANAAKLGTVAIAAAGAAAAAFAVKSLIRIEQIGAQTDAVIKSTGGAANITRGQIDELAGSLEELTGAEAESTTMGQNMLLTFTNIKNGAGKNNKIFDEATKIMLDMGTAMNGGVVPAGEQLKATSIQLGKALNDPIKGMTALRKVGVTFTEDQIKQIKTMQESGDMMGAQRVILAELNKEFGGSAEAYGQTTAGKVAILKHRFGTLTETLMAGVMPAFLKLTERVSDFYKAFTEQGGTTKIINFFKALWAVIVNTRNAIVNFFTKTQAGMFIVELFRVLIGFVVDAAKQLWAIIVQNKDMFIFLGKVLGVTLVVAIAAVLAVLYVIIKVLGWVVKLANLFYQAFIARPIQGFKAWGAAYKSMISTVKSSFASFVNWHINLIVKIINKFNELKNSIRNAFSSLSNIGGNARGFLGKIGIPGFASGVRNFSGGLAVVGENGPELVNLPKGSDVYPNSMGTITNNIYGNIELGDKSAVDAFFAKLNRNGELARKGLATYGG